MDRSEVSEVVKTESIDFIPAWMPFCHQAVFMKLNDCHFDTRYKIAADYHLFYNLYFKDGKSAFYVKDRLSNSKQDVVYAADAIRNTSEEMRNTMERLDSAVDGDDGSVFHDYAVHVP